MKRQPVALAAAGSAIMYKLLQRLRLGVFERDADETGSAVERRGKLGAQPLPAAELRQTGHGRETTGLMLVSANFGGIDTIKPFPVMAGVDSFYYTQADTLADADPAAAASWTRVIIPDYPRHDFGPRLRGRYFKHQIHRLPEAEGYRWLAWADASLQFRDPSFLLREANRLATLPPHQRVALVPHPDRRTVREEYQYICRKIEVGSEYHRLRYAQEKMTEQMDFFAGRGWNLEARLWCGTIWLIENNDLIARCWDSWWDQNLRYGMMDQLSLPVLLQQFRLEPQVMDFNLWKNPYFDWVTHRTMM